MNILKKMYDLPKKIRISLIIIVWLLLSAFTLSLYSGGRWLDPFDHGYVIVNRREAYCLEKHGSDLDKRDGCEDKLYWDEYVKRENIYSALFLAFFIFAPIYFVFYVGKTIYIQRIKR